MPKTAQTPAAVLSSLMEQYQLNPFSLSKAIYLSNSAIRQIISGKSKISIPTAMRLSKFFGQTPEYWLDLQRETDLTEAKKDQDLMVIIQNISKVQKPKSAPAAKTKPAKKTTIADKRKEAAKVPGSKPASRNPKKQK